MKKNYFIITILCVLFANSGFTQTILSGTLSCSKTLVLSGSPYYASSSLTVLNGCVLTVNPGVEIQMANNAYLIVKGKVNFMGTAAQPIIIHAKDTIWGNILLDNTLTQKSVFNYVNIENARRSANLLQEPAAIYGLYSSVEVKNCHFKNNLRCISLYQCPNTLIKDCILDSTNRGEKIHGQYCSGSVVDGNILYFTAGDCDAIDFDASNNLLFTNNYIYGGEDDGFDLGQCDSIGCNNVTVQGNYIFNMLNKGISDGEYCINVNLNHNVIVGCAIGIGAKSGAYVTADHNTLYGNRCGIKSYDHVTQIWGPGHLTVTNCIIAGSDTTYHVDPTAFLSVTYTLADDTIIPGTGNIKGNPAFVNPLQNPAGDFHLTSVSKAINMGDPSFVLDSDGTRTDMGAFFYNSLTNIRTIVISDVMNIYPNPSDGIFHIHFSDKAILEHSGNLQLKVLNTNGQIVYSEKILQGQLTEKNDITLNKQSKGIYYLQLISDKNVSISKLVLN